MLKIGYKVNNTDYRGAYKGRRNTATVLQKDCTTENGLGLCRMRVQKKCQYKCHFNIGMHNKQC